MTLTDGAVFKPIPAGTTLRMARVVFFYDWRVSNLYYIALFLDGPLVGKPAILNRVSKGELSVSLKSWTANI